MRHNYKKVFAGALAVILAANTLAAMGAIESHATAGTPGGSGSLEGVLGDVFNVVVPTLPNPPVSENTIYRSIYDFILDPHGLASTGSLAGKTLEPGATIYFQNAPGSAYDYSSTSDALAVINKSTIDVDVKLNAELTGMDDIRLTGSSNFQDDTSASVYFALKDGKKRSTSIDTYGAFLQTTLKGRPDAYKVIYDHATGRYSYQLKSDADLEKENITFDEYSFQLSGRCNSANSWAKVPSTMNPEITVTWNVSVRPKDLTPSIGKTSYEMSKGADIAIAVDLGAGRLAAKGIKAIKYSKATGEATLATDKYTFTNGMLIFKGSYISEVINAGITAREYTIIFNDDVETRVKVQLSIDNMAPSIEKTSYVMEAGKEIPIEVDLGLGSLGATGIKSITYNKATGSATLATDKYTFNKGILTFNSSYITDVIRAGVVSRDYTIIFNNKAETEVTVTFSVEGTAPSVGTTDYVMSRDQDVEVDIDLGDGGLAATGIKSITYNTASGLRTLSADRYMYKDGILTINGSYISSVMDAGVVSRDYTILFDNAAGTTATITLTAEDKAPSIAAGTYRMQNGKDVAIDVDLGSGSLGATGIKTITYETKAGTKALAAENYTYANGVLTLKASYISNVIGAGVVSRDYEIVLNDTAETTGTVTLEVEGIEPSVGAASYIIRRDQPVSVDVDLGSGDLAAGGIKSITYNTAAGLRTLTTDRYTYKDGILTISGSYISSVISAGVVSRDYTILFDNAVGTTATITLTSEDKAPVIGAGPYRMQSGKDVSISVDLGSGSLGATGIKAITYDTKTGTRNLAAQNYTYANGTLTLKASYITSVIGAGVASRDYTIVLNDAAETTETVTLQMEGTAPSVVGAVSYAMKREQPIEVNVDLGSGDLAASGIKSITYNTASGLTTLAANKYTFKDGVLTIAGSYISSVINVGVVSRDYTIHFDNAPGTEAVITLTAESKAPSVGTTTYTMSKNNNILVDTDLGSGDLRAANIKSITYKKNNTSTSFTTLPTSYYTVTNGKLLIRASYVNGVIDAGITSRDYIITFDDKAQTSVTVTFTK
jgi:hypothetical protein